MHIFSSLFLSSLYFINSGLIPFWRFLDLKQNGKSYNNTIYSMIVQSFGDIFISPFSYAADPAFLYKEYQIYQIRKGTKISYRFLSNFSLFQMMSYSDMGLEGLYAEITNRYLMGMFFFPIFPIYALIESLSIVSKIFISKHKMMFRSSNPEVYTKLYTTMIRSLLMGPAIYSVGSISYDYYVSEDSIDGLTYHIVNLILCLALFLYFIFVDSMRLYEKWFHSQQDREHLNHNVREYEEAYR